MYEKQQQQAEINRRKMLGRAEFRLKISGYIGEEFALLNISIRQDANAPTRVTVDDGIHSCAMLKYPAMRLRFLLCLRLNGTQFIPVIKMRKTHKLRPFSVFIAFNVQSNRKRNTQSRRRRQRNNSIQSFKKEKRPIEMVEWTTLITIVDSEENCYAVPPPTKDGQSKLLERVETQSSGEQSAMEKLSDDDESDTEFEGSADGYEAGTESETDSDAESSGSQPKRRRIQHSAGLLERIWYSMTGYVIAKKVPSELDAKVENELGRNED
ncbi:hypothetical protein GHT06_016280 [Daphnia sinensis]|uniref:Uncharacterized protein n=1 Tax=Daphnia sinensis TaxID=1820382 RepID=A0AAD5KN65_9CRUS|nr:hypothetical protein GHT06_016280 [Daphnia sinensis]